MGKLDDAELVIHALPPSGAGYGEHIAEAILTESQVVDAVRGHLERQGWTILVHATAIQHGHDLVANEAASD